MFHRQHCPAPSYRYSGLAVKGLLLFALALPPATVAAPKSELEQSVEQVLRQGGLRGAVVGVLVRDLNTGAIVYDRNADTPLIPASLTKIVTSATALVELSPQYTFESGLYSDGRQVGATWQGDAYLVARGDPSLVDERVWVVANELRKRGIRRIVGSLVVDDSYFDSVRFGYDWGAPSRAWYQAPHGAVSVNFNTVPARGRWIAIADDPSVNAGQVFKRVLEQQGIELEGKLLFKGVAPATAKPLAVSESKPLTQVMADLNKVSNNFIAEQILKTLGAERRGVPGTADKGLEVVAAFLQGIGVKGGFELHDGSGLSASNRLSPRVVTQVLMAMRSDFEVGAEFMASLKVAGVEGKSSRFQDELCLRKMRIKTGHLYGTAALAGYAETRSGRQLVFTIIANEYRRGRYAADRGIEQLCHLFLDDGPASPPQVALGVRREGASRKTTVTEDDGEVEGEGEGDGGDEPIDVLRTDGGTPK